MSKRGDPTVIGAFVIGAVALIAVAVAVWGSGRLFQDNRRFVCYFEDSVNGLDVGAPVKTRGVSIGKVISILLHFRQRVGDRRIPVVIEVSGKRLRELGMGDQDMAQMTGQIAQGLRARLESQSVVTGSMFLNIGWFPDTPVVMSEIDPAHGYPEIPTARPPLAEAGESVGDVLADLKRADFASLARSMDKAAASIDRLAGGAETHRMVSETTVAIQAYRRLADELGARVPSLLDQVEATVGQVRKTVVGIDGVAGGAGRLIKPEAPLSVELNDALGEVARAAKAMRELSEYLRRNPNALLVGKPL